MNDLPVVLLVLAIVATIITLVGHGIWVLLAALFGSAGKKPNQACPFCGRSTSTTLGRCDWCSKELTSPRARELQDLDAVRRQVQRLREKGALTPSVADEMLGQVQNYRQRLLHPAAAKHVAPIVTEQIVEEAAPSRPLPETPATFIDVLGQAQKPDVPHPESISPSIPEVIAPPQVPESPVVVRPAALRPVPAAARPQSAAPSRSWTEVLAAFMEQRNIRWGELIGGLLFVCSSVALVVSLWETLERIPYSKFFIFVSISSAVFGVGLYAHHRWKLESTSRALLVIATLLVPLNFVAMASLAKGEWTQLALVSELVSLAIFVYLVGLAARILVPEGRWLIVTAVLGDSIAVLLIAQWVRTDSPAWWMVGTGALPVALFAGAVGWFLYSQLDRAKWRPSRLTDVQIGFVFTLLGITVFSTVVALGLLVARAITPQEAALLVTPRDVAIVLQRLSILCAVAAVPVLAGGLTVMRGSGRDKELAAYHLAGTTVALVAMLAMLAALGMAWPAPAWLIAVAVLNTIALVFAAFRWRLPVLHSGAIACAALAYLTAFFLLTGQLTSTSADPYGTDLLWLMISARSGTALAGLFLALAVVSEYLARVGRHRHGVIYLSACGVVASVGLLLVTVHGIRTGGADALRAAILYAVYGAGSLALTARWRRLGLGYLGLVLVASSALWALWWQSHHVGPLWGEVLALESLLMAVIATVLQRYTAGAWFDLWIMFEDRPAISRPRSNGLVLLDLYRIPLIHVAEATASIAAALTVYTAIGERAAILAFHTPAPIVASMAIAAVFFLLAWLYRSPERTWIASLLVLAGAVHALNFNYFPCADYIGPNWTIALLGHATLAMLAVLGLVPLVTQAGRTPALWAEVRRAIGDPLADSALLASVLALPALVFGRSAGSLWLACCFPWLAAVWLVLAMRKRSVELFAAHQMALAFAALAAATVWMKHVGWIIPIELPTVTPNLLERIASYRHVVLEPRNLQAYGVALGLLSLAWVVVRIIDLSRVQSTGAIEQRWSAKTQQRSPENGESALRLTTPDGLSDNLLQSRYSVDGCIRHGVVVMQWLVVVFCMLAETPRELLRGAAVPATIPQAFGPTAWVLLGVLGLMLAATLWERWRTTELVATLLAAATVPCLIAGRFAADLAVASASRWTLAIGFLACSIAVWRRANLADACRRVQSRAFASAPETSRRNGPRVARAVLLATMVLPVLAITVLAAQLQIGGTAPGGPLAKTFFQTIGPTWSYLVPLVLVIGALVGYALRERSSGYAFFAGLVLEMAVVLGYSLRTTLARGPFDASFVVTLIQLIAITAAVWAIAWLVVRKRFDVWCEHFPSLALRIGTAGEGNWPRRLMSVQIGMAILANVLVLGIALFDLALLPIRWQPWSVAAGGALGWISLGLPLMALQLRGRLRSHTVGLSGMAVLGLLACTIRGLQPCWHLDIDPIWGYRTLMLGWANYALLVVAATWWIASLRTAPGAAGPPQGLIRLAAVWVRAAGALAVMLGLKAAFWHDGELLWAAAAIAIASGAGATMAVWRRREGWAFAAALGVNVAASLVVWHFELLRHLSFNDYWLRLVQANVIASAAVAAVWLAARKRLYRLREMTLGESPLLATQVLLPVAGNCALLILPVAWLLHTPDHLPRWMNELAAPQGWIGLLLAAAAAAWYVQ